MLKTLYVAGSILVSEASHELEFGSRRQSMERSHPAPRISPGDSTDNVQSRLRSVPWTDLSANLRKTSVDLLTRGQETHEPPLTRLSAKSRDDHTRNVLTRQGSQLHSPRVELKPDPFVSQECMDIKKQLDSVKQKIQQILREL